MNNLKPLILILTLFLFHASKSQEICLILNENLTEIIQKDQFSPPVAARIYAYSNLAAYYILSAIDQNDTTYKLSVYDFSFKPIDNKYNDKVIKYATILCYEKVASKLIYSEIDFQTSNIELKNKYALSLSSNEVTEAKSIADTISKLISKRIEYDGYKERNTFVRYKESSEEKYWKYTPPAFGEPVEPYWSTIKPFFIPSDSVLPQLAPVEYSVDKSSAYWKNLHHVYSTSTKLSDSLISIARHWDCNPMQLDWSGHTMDIKFRMTPAGHWMSIASQLCKDNGLSDYKTAKILFILSGAMHDAFLHCWTLKYKFNTVRPITVIQKYIQSEWKPIIDTPVFPEYPSGHSEVSATAAIILEHFFGKEYAFIDNSQIEFGLPLRHFNSLMEAAIQAGESRFYGGIHYTNSIEDGKNAGIEIGNRVMNLITNK